MKQIEITAEKREDTGSAKARAARRAGRIPAVIYGSDQPSVKLSVAEKDFRAALRAGADKGLVNVTVDGRATLAIVKETQYDPLGDEIHHVDFFRVTMGKPIHVTVPVVTVGRASGEAEGGIVEHLTREINVECLPGDIPEQVTVDITPVALGQGLHLSDVPPPEGTTFLDPPETALVVVKAPRMAAAAARTEEEAAAEAEEGAEPTAAAEGGEGGEPGEPEAGSSGA